MTGCHTQTLVIRGAQTSHMTSHLASTQQRRANAGPLWRRMPASCPPLEGQVDGTDGAGRLRLETARPLVNATKAAMIAVMWEFDRPMTSAELYGIFDGERSLKAIEYHLSTLVRANVAEVVFGPELHFQLVPVSGDTKPLFRERCR